MHIILSGAWPEPEIAKELATHVEKQAPTLTRWLTQGKAISSKSLATDTKCLPTEDWLLQACNFTPEPGQNISAGLGPLLHNVDDDKQVWLADLIHMAPSRDGAALLPANTLNIESAQAQELLNSAEDFFTDNGFSFSPTDKPYRWRINWPREVQLNCASPGLVAISSVNDWWPQDDSARSWRRLCNSLQMAWFEHPINYQRQTQGLAPINSMWLYGGARKQQLKASLPQDLQVNSDLHHFLSSQDWGGWINTLAQLEASLFSKITTKNFTLVLTGREKFATVNVKPSLINRFKPNNWRNWWSSL